MSSAQDRDIAEVITEVEGALVVRKKLEGKNEQQSVFNPEWMDTLLRSRVQQLEDTGVSSSMTQGFDHLGRLLDIQHALMERHHFDLVNQLTLVIIRQKSSLASRDKDHTAGIHTNPRPFMTGAIPYHNFEHIHHDPQPSFDLDGVQDNFPLLALGSDNIKFSGANEDLCLVWREDRGALQCKRLGDNLTNPDVLTTPGPT
ncbi:MAG: hypothetical protein Q9170_007431 [Blastenia crenularia]